MRRACDHPAHCLQRFPATAPGGHLGGGRRCPERSSQSETGWLELMEQNLGEEGAARTETNPGCRVSQLARGQLELLALGNLRGVEGIPQSFPGQRG